VPEDKIELPKDILAFGNMGGFNPVFSRRVIVFPYENYEYGFILYFLLFFSF
jgi:hypothetical protein